MALATDDPGVSRIDITNEYDLRWRELKDLARASLEHAFLPGRSLWRSPDVFGSRVRACAADAPGIGRPRRTCRAFLRSSEKATVQFEQEARTRRFERRLS